MESSTVQSESRGTKLIEDVIDRQWKQMSLKVDLQYLDGLLMKKEQIKIARVRHEVNKRSIIMRVPIKQIPTWNIKKTQKTENQSV